MGGVIHKAVFISGDALLPLYNTQWVRGTDDFQGVNDRNSVSVTEGKSLCIFCLHVVIGDCVLVQIDGAQNKPRWDRCRDVDRIHRLPDKLQEISSATLRKEGEIGSQWDRVSFGAAGSPENRVSPSKAGSLKVRSSLGIFCIMQAESPNRKGITNNKQTIRFIVSILSAVMTACFPSTIRIGILAAKVTRKSEKF